MLSLEEIYMTETYAVIIKGCALVVGLAGNATACIVILCSRSLYTLTDFYLLSLSLSDILILITVCLRHFHDYYMQFAAGKVIFSPETFLFDSAVAHYINVWTFNTSVYASIFTVTAFTVERCVAVCNPFLAQSMSKILRAKIIVIAIWSIAALLESALAVARFIVAEIGNQHRMVVRYYTETIVTCSCFFAANLVIAMMYILITFELRKSSNIRQINSHADRANRKALKMFVIIISIFFLSWAPYFIKLVVHYNIPLEDNYFASYDKLFFIDKAIDVTFALPSVLNPVIYTIMSEKFRIALKDLLTQARRKSFVRASAFTSTQVTTCADV